jgi:hypothetical protein
LTDLKIQEYVFNTSFYSIYTHFNTEKIKQYVKKLKVNLSGNHKTTFFINEKLIVEDSLKEFMEHISKHILVYVTQIQNKTNFSFIDCWFQIYNYQNNHDIHNHGMNLKQYSLIYYVQSSVDSGATRFYPPGFPYIDSGNIDIRAEDNKLVIFPSHLAHQALPNKDKERIIFSANFTIE